MKEFNFKIKDTIFNGLRRFSNNQREDEMLIECHNLAPAENGLELHEYITSMNESASFGGVGEEAADSTTRSITLNVNDFVTLVDLETVSVYLDAVLKGTTDVNGDITIADVEVGGHALYMTKTGYKDSNLDTIYNDFIMVI